MAATDDPHGSESTSPWWAWLPVLAGALTLTSTAEAARRILTGSLDIHYFNYGDGTLTPGIDFLQRWRVLWSENLLLPGLAMTTLGVLSFAVLARADRSTTLGRPTRLAGSAVAALTCLSAAAVLAGVAFDLSQADDPQPLTMAAATRDPDVTHVYPTASCVLMLGVLCGLVAWLLAKSALTAAPPEVEVLNTSQESAATVNDSRQPDPVDLAAVPEANPSQGRQLDYDRARYQRPR